MKNTIRKLTEKEIELSKIKIYPARFKDMDVWFTDERVKLPDDCSLYKYEVRSDDDGCGDPVEISTNILVNFYGTIISEKQIDLPITGITQLKYANIVAEENDFIVVWSERKHMTVLDLILQNKEKKWI